jgi:hypothetical protein
MRVVAALSPRRCALRIAVYSRSTCFLCTIQMIRRRLVVERITNPCWYACLSTETIISTATVISVPNLRSYLMCVANTST